MPLNLAGAELDESIKQRIARLREIAREAGLIQ